jgi:lysophospholipase L1-like esterase
VLTRYHWALDVVVRNYDAQGLDNVRAAMRGFSEIRSAGIPVVAVLFPYLYAPAYPKWGLGRFHEVYAEAAAANGIPFLDLRALFEQSGVSSDRWPQDPVHPEEPGHRLAARAIAEFLTGLGLVASSAGVHAAGDAGGMALPR